MVYVIGVTCHDTEYGSSRYVISIGMYVSLSRDIERAPNMQDIYKAHWRYVLGKTPFLYAGGWFGIKSWVRFFRVRFGKWRGGRRLIICYFYAEVGSMVGCEVYG